MKILVAEDDVPLADFLQQRLGQEQFTVQIASTGSETQRLATEQPFDMVLLDLNLNGAASLDVLRGIRAKKPDMPVMLLTGTNQLDDRIRGLDGGADDYVTKPFAFAELAARIRAVLRRGARPGQAMLQVDDLKLDRLTHRTARRAFHRFEPEGICAAGISDDSSRTSGLAFRDCRARLEIEFRHDDQRRGRLHQLSASQDRFGL